MKRASGGGQLKVVVDTNVYISLFLYPERPIFQVLQRAGKGQYQLLTSPAIIQELGRVMREDFEVADKERIRLLKQITAVAEIITPTTALTVITDDPPDNRILECALDGKAALIISGDYHLRRLKAYQGIPIIRPTDFLHTLGVSLKK